VSDEKRLYFSDDECIEDAIKQHPECSYGRIVNGMNCFFQLTRVVRLWRNEECANAGDPHRHEVEGYPA
jgi:hypothetical protein